MGSEYVFHEIKKVYVIGPHALRLVFEDGFAREIDFVGMLAGQRFEPLNDPEFFKQVRINPDFETIEWPNGADFSPNSLYDWDETLPYWKEATDQWRKAAMLEHAEA